MAFGNLSYQLEDTDPKVSRITWELAVAIADEYRITLSEAAAVSAFDMSRALFPD
ncbi:hypothetical protein QA600_21830 [Natronococcus sp. A-GB1]|uniref:hypothetical protein n=1 Tax=Natronococcus sp. A-GB1 TaxID=3037648 RepID=UPI00241C28D6|nr:hypothetical protein [Natronococcus sp. A-GB1]MDG5761964.1 hypothetical protein [Natronococcus sp. A-GB1]